MATNIQSFGYGTSSFAQFAFSGNDLSTYALPSGSSITGSVGSVTQLSTTSVVPTGSAGTFSTGSVTAYPGPESNDTAFGEVAFSEDAFAGSNVSLYVEVTGSGMTSTAGSVASVTGTANITPTGSTGTFSIGNAVIGIGVPVTGSSATFSVSDITIDIGVTAFPTGSAATFSTGTLLIEIGVNATGSAITSSVGSVTTYRGAETNDTAFAEDAWAAQPFAGSNQSTYVTPGGNAGTFSIGSLTITGTGLITPTGSAGTFSIGDVVIASVYDVTGNEATFSEGDVTATGGATVIPTGSVGTFSIGAVVIEIGVPVTGSEATFSIGNTTVLAGAIATPTGSVATFSTGTVNLSIWNEVDNSVTNTWTEVAKT